MRQAWTGTSTMEDLENDTGDEESDEDEGRRDGGAFATGPTAATTGEEPTNDNTSPWTRQQGGAFTSEPVNNPAEGGASRNAFNLWTPTPRE